ncbi:hypothetical protein [Chryseobacterium populi]|uniref:Glycine zipper family protein n=1 Tax=Chryseobacterium populi TaxID=1144316 RepID=J2KH46_9FLAO|nr:hypothetical protein [Chryseobacterium populi]EJL72443.1 hypothetical protein PMI13_01935 [Chryseobacterium populi]
MKKSLFVVGACLLLMLQSCHNTDDLSVQDTPVKTESHSKALSRIGETDNQTLSGYVKNQLAIQSGIKVILDSEVNADFSLIQSRISSVTTVEELEALYKEAKIERFNDLISSYTSMADNTQAFRNANPEFYSRYTEEQRTAMLTQEIDLQLNYREESALTARRNCHTEFTSASRRCMRNFAIEVGMSAVGGIFTGGAGAVVGGAAATVHMVVCNSDADSDYHGCVRAGGQP